MIIPMRCYIQSTYTAEEGVKRNVDHRMKIGSDIVNFFDFYKQDDATSNAVLNLSNYNKDGSSEAAHCTWVLLEEEKA